jgi:hypothetical protein
MLELAFVFRLFKSVSDQLSDKYSIYRCRWNVATYTCRWKVHNGKIEIISVVKNTFQQGVDQHDVVQELLTLAEHQSTPPVFSRGHVAHIL